MALSAGKKHSLPEGRTPKPLGFDNLWLLIAPYDEELHRKQNPKYSTLWSNPQALTAWINSQEYFQAARVHFE